MAGKQGAENKGPELSSELPFLTLQSVTLKMLSLIYA